MNFIAKFKFLQKKRPVIIITGERKKIISKIISNLLKNTLVTGEDFLIFESKLKDIKNLELFLKTSKKPVLVVAGIENISEKELITISKFIKTLPEKTNLILSSNDEMVKKMGYFLNLNTLSFGFQEPADFRVSDIKSNGGTNFKVNYQGTVIPFWLKKIAQREEISSVVCAALVATVFGLNLVEISQALKQD